MESALSWTLTNANHHSITILFCTEVSPCVNPSFHHILKRSPFAIPSVPFNLQSLSSGSLAIHLFQATTSQTKQPKKLPSLPQTQLFPSLYLALFKPSMKRFVMLHQHTDGVLLSSNFEGFLETSSKLRTEKMTF